MWSLCADARYMRKSRCNILNNQLEKIEEFDIEDIEKEKVFNYYIHLLARTLYKEILFFTLKNP